MSQKRGREREYSPSYVHIDYLGDLYIFIPQQSHVIHFFPAVTDTYA